MEGVLVDILPASLQSLKIRIAPLNARLAGLLFTDFTERFKRCQPKLKSVTLTDCPQEFMPMVQSIYSLVNVGDARVPAPGS
jgi:hypothetical protein